MKRSMLFVLVVSFVSLPLSAFAADSDSSASPVTTKAGGSLTADEVWTAGAGPYLLTASLTIPSGHTLTIEPGTSVYLNSGVDLKVSNGGCLLAEGTETQPIRFTRPPDTTASWGGITISGAAKSPESRLAYVYFEGNGDTCIELAAGTLSLDHATFGTNTRRYLSLNGGSFLISHCHFPPAASSFELLYGSGSIKAGGRGIVRSCFFGAASGYSDAIDFNGGNREDEQPILQVYNCVFMGSGDDLIDLDGTDAWIEGNIFLHCHRNGAKDSAACVSGGTKNNATSQVTIIGNLFFDCDNAATVKQGNFFTLINNTMVHTTRKGGVDFDSGVVAVRDMTPSPTTFAAGVYLEGNIVTDTEKLIRSYDADQTSVTLVDNILPSPWDGPGRGNVVVDPQFQHVPQVSETSFTTWQEAQVMREWLSLREGSAGRGTGPNGTDRGGVVPLGVSIAGEPAALTHATAAVLTVGVNRAGDTIPEKGFPLGSGFTHYKWRLDGGAWSEETPIDVPIQLTGLGEGPHQVEAVGRNDAGWYQNDPEFRDDAVVAASRRWTVDRNYSRLVINEVLANGRSCAEAVELYYEGPDLLDLSGMTVSDDPNEPNKFVFPAGTALAPGQYLTLLADANATSSGIHLGFALDEEGDGLYLCDRSGALVDAVEFGRQVPDLSIGRVGYEGQWQLTTPTRGQMNEAHPAGNPDLVRINEWLAGSFVELYNPQGYPVDVRNLELTDGSAASNALNASRPLSFMPARGFQTLWAQPSNDPLWLGLDLPSSGGTISLSDSQTGPIDSVTYGPQVAGVSQGRVPDGGALITALPAPTPGAENWPGSTIVTEPGTLVREDADKRVVVPTAKVDDGWKGGQVFDDSAWMLCTGSPGGVGYERDTAYETLITLDTESRMYGSGKNATCYVRVPFTADPGAWSDIRSLTLSVRCDDAFIAYLNGVEIARKNFAGVPTWNSRADSSIEAAVTSFDAVVDVTAFKNLLQDGANILAVHAMNNSTTSSDFLLSVALDAMAVRVESQP